MILALIFFLVILAFLAQYFKVKSVYMCSPALIMPFNYLTVILGLLIDLIVFDSHYNWMIIMGMALASCGLLSKFIMIKFQK
jgi:drug/metabolite transporter (DMT)-like permease